MIEDFSMTHILWYFTQWHFTQLLYWSEPFIGSLIPAFLDLSSNHTVIRERFVLIPLVAHLIIGISMAHTLWHITWWHFPQFSCWSESSTGNPFRDLDNLLILLPRSMISLKELICTIFTNKMHIFFSSL